MDQEWYFYIIRCRDSSLYAGITNNLDSRLKEHNRGTGAKYTSGRRPVALVYYEKFPDVSKARQREIQIKRWAKSRKERLIVGFPRHSSH